jgi:hypothetical protein
MLQDVFDRLSSLGLAPTRIGYEVHVNVAGTGYAVADAPLRVREKGRLQDGRPCGDVEEVLALLGVERARSA